MKKHRKKLFLLMISLMFVLAASNMLFSLSKSREYQFFGELLSSLPNDGKQIALTFDDGPTEHTQLILDKLTDLDIKATFFLCGNNINERPTETQAITAAGHAIGNHSYSHTRMVLVSYQFCQEEIEKTNELILASGYEDTIFFRPPYCKKLIMLPLYLRHAGITSITWDIEPETGLGVNASAEDIAQNIISNVKSGSIILLHPMYAPDRVLAALDMVVPELKAQGFYFATIPDLYRQYNE